MNAFDSLPTEPTPSTEPHGFPDMIVQCPSTPASAPTANSDSPPTASSRPETANSNGTPNSLPLEQAREFFASTLVDQIHLVASTPDGPAEGHDFGTDVDGALDWASIQNQRGRNIHWTVNSVRSGVNNVPGKHDMVGARFAHVDMTSHKDGDAWSISETFFKRRELGKISSMIVLLEYGLYIIWRLTDASFAQVEWINNRLISWFNVERGTGESDRLLPVPGFMYFPTREDAARRRMPVMVSIAIYNKHTHYTFDDIRTTLLNGRCDGLMTRSSTSRPDDM